MKKLPILLAVLTPLALPAFAADDPIKVRQTLMDSNGASAGVAAGIMKDEIAYNPAVAKAVLASMAAVAQAYGDFFPEGSEDASRSHAAPAIWEDPEGFAAELGKFQSSTSAGVEAAGRGGPADKAAFVALMQPVFDSCTSCHEGYRLEN